jgi:hypothetical protein
MQSEETHSTTDPPDIEDEDTPCAVMAGDLYQLRVVVSAAPGDKNINYMKVGLDTCAGVNLIRKNHVPYGANIRRAPTVTKVKAAQG